MASSDIRRFRFNSNLIRYKWGWADFDNFQTWLRDTMKAMAEGLSGAAVLTGMQVTPLSGMTVRVSPGIAIDADGQILVLSANTDVVVASPTGDPSRSYVVIRKKLTDTNPVPIPLNPSLTTDLHEIQGAEVVVLDGTPAPSPNYPALASGDVVLMGLRLIASHATIQRSDYDVGQRYAPNTMRKRVRDVSAAYTATVSDDIIEGDASTAAFTVTLPLARDALGKVLTVLKTDSGGNAVTVAGQGGELISGMASVDLAAQWQVMKLYSDGKSAWRMM